MQRNLDNLIHDAKFSEGTFTLTDAQKADIYSMVGKGCRQKTKERLSRRLDLPLLLGTLRHIFPHDAER